MTGTILVTGGAGYVGSHTVLELVERGFEVVVLDNLSNASEESINRVNEMTGKTVQLHVVDLLDRSCLQNLFAKYQFSCVLHFAGLKAVCESCENPLLYYKNNIRGTVTLLEVMQENGVSNLIFSSSCTVYGQPTYLPVDEKHPAGNCTNPYGRTKYFIEEILKDICSADKKWNVVSLRYFNPVGAHASGRIGEDPVGVPKQLMPFLAQLAVGRQKELTVYGDDYDTPDGTAIRDYIHVVDVAQGHVDALRKIDEQCGFKVYNLGTGRGFSVMEMRKAFEKAFGRIIPYKIAGRRSGDVAVCYADASLAEKELGWKAKLGLSRMCEDLWRWQSTNPNGFQKT